MTSLTRDALLSMTPEAKKVEVDGLGTVYLKPLSELLRSRRMAELHNEKGKIDKAAYEKRRAVMILDQVCDEKGELLFKQNELNKILELDGMKLDKLVYAIIEFNEESEKKEAGE